jgi:hypothetical protein
VLVDTSFSSKFSLSTFGLDLLSTEFLPYMEVMCVHVPYLLAISFACMGTLPPFLMQVG